MDAGSVRHEVRRLGEEGNVAYAASVRIETLVGRQYPPYDLFQSSRPCEPLTRERNA